MPGYYFSLRVELQRGLEFLVPRCRERLGRRLSTISILGCYPAKDDVTQLPSVIRADVNATAAVVCSTALLDDLIIIVEQFAAAADYIVDS